MCDNKLITAANARELLGGISAMTEWRYQQDNELAFPRPVKIRNRNFYREAAILEWINSRQIAAPYSDARERQMTGTSAETN